MRGLFSIVVGGIILFAASAASAQEITYPGAAWSTTGQLSPVERHNIVSANYGEQGVAYKGLSGYIHGGYGKDQNGFDWNNYRRGGAGVRFTQTVGNLMLRVGGSYVTEERPTSKVRINGFVYAVDLYTQWGRK